MLDIFLLLSSFILITSNIEFLISEIEFSNSASTSLQNGNIFIIHKLGICVCDKYLKNIIKQTITFSSDDQLTNFKEILNQNIHFLIMIMLEFLLLMDYLEKLIKLIMEVIIYIIYAMLLIVDYI